MNFTKIAVFAYSDVGYACLKFLIENSENIACVYTHEDKSGENIWFSSVKELAQKNSIPVRTGENLGSTEEFSYLKSISPDLIFSFYYRNLIPSPILLLPRLGAFNMHGSLLPAYRGRAPINWAVLNGETKTGATLHVMVDKADAGDIVDQEEVSIGPDDTAYLVQGELTKAAVRILSRQIKNLKSGKTHRVAQNHSQATYFGRRRPEDGEIDWNWPAARIHNCVRALTHPYPGAFGELFSEKVWIWKTSLDPKKAEEKGLSVVCGDGKKIELLVVQPTGEKEMSGQKFLERYVAAGGKKI